MKYKQTHQNQIIKVGRGESVRVGCCDCKLVHDLSYHGLLGDSVVLKFTRNERATAARRRKRKARARQ